MTILLVSYQIRFHRGVTEALLLSLVAVGTKRLLWRDQRVGAMNAEASPGRADNKMRDLICSFSLLGITDIKRA